MNPTANPPYVALIGGANMDISAHAHAPMRAADSNPGVVRCSPWGVARNVAENLCRLDVDARLLSVLGDDTFALVMRQAANAIGLDMRACATLQGQRTATYVSLHGVDGDMSVAVNDMDILEQLTPALVLSHASLLEHAQAIVVDCNVRPDVLQTLCSHWPQQTLIAEAVSVAKCHKLLPVLSHLHTLKANRMEAQALTGMEVAGPQSARKAAAELHARGVRQVVISMAENGVVWCDADGVTGHRAVQPVQMQSATGAGDALLAGLVYAYLQGMPLDRSVAWAMACAELTLSSTFANSPELSVAAVQARLEQHTL